MSLALLPCCSLGSDGDHADPSDTVTINTLPNSEPLSYRWENPYRCRTHRNKRIERCQERNGEASSFFATQPVNQLDFSCGFEIWSVDPICRSLQRFSGDPTKGKMLSFWQGPLVYSGCPSREQNSHALKSTCSNKVSQDPTAMIYLTFRCG